MKKSALILLFGIFLNGCSALAPVAQLLYTPTPPPAPSTQTPAPTVTLIPTRDLFATSTSTPVTFTPTETPLIPDQPPTSTPTALPTLGPPPDVQSGDYFTPKNVGFLSVLISNNILYWNEGPCMPRNVRVSAFVEDLLNTEDVVLFMRLREKKNTLNVTEWGAGAIMLRAENGSFNYNVHTWNLRRYYYFKDAWLEYQLVAVNQDRQVIGRTQIYDRNISLVRCMPVQ
ncbi:MAG TPA: hypothetical protein VI524_07750 [Anaerolineales bacterium]|nr:hypothetical protein [Anaerolineales bacterium]